MVRFRMMAAWPAPICGRSLVAMKKIGFAGKSKRFKSCAAGASGVPAGLYILQSGEANLMLESTTGNAVMCLRAGAGCLLGLPAIIGNEPYSLTAMVRRSAEVRFVTRADFEDVMQANPSLYPKLLRVLAAEVRTARRAFSEI